jgi:hypothetical protein
VTGQIRDEAFRLERAEAELAEIKRRQGATWHHWTEIAAMPQAWTSKRPAGDTCHESVMRSFHVAAEVRRLLELGTPPAVVLQVMNLLEQRGAPEVPPAAVAENSQVPRGPDPKPWRCGIILTALSDPKPWRCGICAAGTMGQLWACPWCGGVRCRRCTELPACCDRGAQE